LLYRRDDGVVENFRSLRHTSWQLTNCPRRRLHNWCTGGCERRWRGDNAYWNIGLCHLSKHCRQITLIFRSNLSFGRCATHTRRDGISSESDNSGGGPYVVDITDDVGCIVTKCSATISNNAHVITIAKLKTNIRF